MPEPLSANSGLGMNVTVLPYFLATFLMMYLYMHIWSAIFTRSCEPHVDFRLAGGGHFVVLGLDVDAALDHRDASSRCGCPSGASAGGTGK